MYKLKVRVENPTVDKCKRKNMHRLQQRDAKKGYAQTNAKLRNAKLRNATKLSTPTNNRTLNPLTHVLLNS